MKAYSMFLVAALLLYTGGIVCISSGKPAVGCTLLALGCTFFAVARGSKTKGQ